MKKLIVLAAAVLATSVQASSDLEFGDVNYFLKSGQFNLASNFSVPNYEVKDKVSKVDEEFMGYVLDTRLGYGITDSLNAFVGIDLSYNFERKIKGDRDSDHSGFSNPYFGANYRLLNQSASGVNLDLGAIARVKIQDAKESYDGKDGTFNRGYNTLEVNASVGQKWNEANEWRLTAAAIQNFEGEYDYASSAGTDKVDTEAKTDLALTAAYQYRPVQEFMMLVSLQAVRVGEDERKAKDSNTKQVDEAHTDFHFNFTAKYLITESLIAKFNYGISRFAEYDRKTNGAKSEQMDRHGNFYGVGIDWLF